MAAASFERAVQGLLGRIRQPVRAWDEPVDKMFKEGGGGGRGDGSSRDTASIFGHVVEECGHLDAAAVGEGVRVVRHAVGDISMPGGRRIFYDTGRAAMRGGGGDGKG